MMKKDGLYFDKNWVMESMEKKPEYLFRGVKYQLKIGYQKDNLLRKSLDSLAQTTFGGLSFEAWYQAGYWQDQTIPYTLFDGDHAAANVFISLFDTALNGQKKRCVQIGTVMTECTHRKRGLARFLMEAVLRDWKDQCDVLYLYANDSVIDFYPKFGFQKTSEYQYSTAITSKPPEKIEKLDLNCPEHAKRILNQYWTGNPYCALSMQGNAGVLLFNCMNFWKYGLFYLEQQNVLVVGRQEGNEFFCADVFGSAEKPLLEILQAVVKPQTKRVKLGFTPAIRQGFDASLLKEEDTTLFVLGENDNPFIGERLMFPVLSRA
jgi:predicted N-acetyltransferase YhbS